MNPTAQRTLALVPVSRSVRALEPGDSSSTPSLIEREEELACCGGSPRCVFYTIGSRWTWKDPDEGDTFLHALALLPPFLDGVDGASYPRDKTVNRDPPDVGNPPDPSRISCHNEIFLPFPKVSPFSP
ncbi:hypothetical protein EYF80_038656 [Liparis tanakae]|uniref:Uncharacterized protein n=1 Tax=Liparis tanakae TaxID=230148 RepID=A0A4Z2GDD1_9TELE|nr:hypothetical protein EYF80_038656 [Liparis tanakae]